MSEISVKNWVQFLKSSQIVSTNSDTVTGKLIYKKKVTTDDLIRFLDGMYGLEDGINFATPEEIVGKIIPSKKNSSSQEDEFDGFTDIPGDEITEIDVKNVFLFIKSEQHRILEEEALEEKDAEISAIKEAIQDWPEARRRVFINLVNAISAHNNIVHVARIEDLFQLFATPDAKPRFFGMLVTKKIGPSSEDLEKRWVEASCPIESSTLLTFWKGLGFEDAAIKQNLSQIDDKANINPYSGLFGIANYVIKNFNSIQLYKIIEYVKTAPHRSENEDPEESEDYSFD